MQTSNSDFQSLVARVQRLEKQNTLLKRAALALLLVAGSFVLTGQARPNRAIEAESFVLRDSTGAKRAELAMDSVSPTLRFFDARGKTRIDVRESSDAPALGPRIELFGGQNRVRLSIGVSHEQPQIIVNDDQGFSAQLGSTPDLVDVRTGAASFIMWDKSGKVLWLAPK